MFSQHPRLCTATAAILSMLLCCGAMLPQKAFAAAQDVRKMLMLYPPATPNTCENIGTGVDPNAPRELTTLPGETRMPCTAVSAAAPAPPHDVPDTVARNSGVSIVCTSTDDLSWNCKNYESLVKANLLAMGKNGEKIIRARERVVEILEQPNSCSAWFQQKDANASATFRSLNFLIDSKGANIIYALKGTGADVLLKHPYVARAIQDGGSYQTITLNLNGAFFQSFAPVMETPIGGGAQRFLTPKDIGVGPYKGGSLAAQVATFLHELGHVEGLLQLDEGDIQGRSKHNTQEMLQYCRAEVEGSGKRATLTASR